ncbi:MAG TPA: hypothetical protein VF263_14525, partial [Longimicrobiaceae bacterium]
MSLSDAVVHLYESDEPSTAFRSTAERLSAHFPLRCAAWMGPGGVEVREAWPGPAEVCGDRLRAACAGPPGLRSEDDADVLVLALGAEGTLVLAGDAGCFGEGGGEWERLARALERVAERERRVRQAEEERDTLRLRAEESEALHVLGLAANRTLDPDEVLNLVARFTRTLLGAHYVTVNTSDPDAHIRTVAAVGLRAPNPDDDPFAARVVEAGKPLTVGGDAHPFGVGEFPFHAAEAMRVGL